MLLFLDGKCAGLWVNYRYQIQYLQFLNRNKFFQKLEAVVEYMNKIIVLFVK